MNYYQILGITSQATQAQIKEAYRKLAKQYHPDAIGHDDPSAENKIKQITQAYNTLSNPEKRRNYDLNISFGFLEETEDDQTQYSSPPRKPVRKKFNQGIIMRGRVFVILLIIVVIMFPVSLAYFSSSYHYNRGVKFLSDGNYYSALVSFRRAIIILGAKSSEAALAAGELELRIRDEPRSAEHFFNQAIHYAENRKELARAHYLMGLTHIVLRDFESAKSDLNESLEAIKDQDSVYFYLQEISYKIDEDLPKALEYSNQLIAINPQYRNGFFLRATINYNLKNLENARDDFNQSILKGDSIPASYYNLGLVNRMLGDSLQACMDMNNASRFGYKNADEWLMNYCINN